jgi:hypothetical protein
MSSVIGLSWRIFFKKTVYEFSDAPFPLHHYMSYTRFVSVLDNLDYNASDPPKYKDRFWEVREMIVVWISNTIRLLFRLYKPIFHTGKLVILDSGFCVLQVIIEMRKRGVKSSALIKKRFYCPKYINGDAVGQHFDAKEVGSADSWPSELDNQDFHVFAVKEPDYVVFLTSTYETNERVTTSRQTERS